MSEEVKENVVETAAAEANAPVEAKTEKKPFNKHNRDNKPRRERESDGLTRKLVSVNRVTKVTKGGKTMRFSALVVVGDKQGKVGIGVGKDAEVPNAIEKAANAAKKAMFSINLNGTTIPHEVIGKFGASQVLLMPAAEGTGVIAGASPRAVLEVVGISNIRCKSYGSRNKINSVRATVEGLKKLQTRAQIAQIRGKGVKEI